jgi:hypothetical protein
MASDYDIALRMQVHYLPTAFPAKARRGTSGRVWIESASVRDRVRAEDRSLVLRFCHSGSPLFVEIGVDALTGMVYTETKHPVVSAVCERINTTVASRGAGRLLTALLATVTREVQLAADNIWPAEGPRAWVPSQRSPLEAVVSDIFEGLASHPALSELESPRARAMAVADGLGQHVSLLVTALHNVRRLLICKPLPHWVILQSGAGGGGGGSGGADAMSSPTADLSSPHAQSSEFDAAALDRSIGGLGSLRALAGQDSSRPQAHVLTALPLDALLLLY